jgi:hypothetical protein
MMQESTMKDMERAFDVLQKRFAIVRGLLSIGNKRCDGK